VAEAEAIVERMENEAAGHRNQGRLPTTSPWPVSATPSHEPEVPARYDSPTLSILLAGRYRSRVIMLAVFHLFQTFGYYGFGTLVPLVLASKGYSIVTSLTFTTLTFVGYPIGSFLSLPIIERVDRKWLIVASAFAMSVLGIGMGYSSTPAAIVLIGFLYTAVSNVFSNALHIFQAEIFPTPIRATAAGTCYGLSRLSSAAMPFVLLPVLQTWGAGPMFVVVAAALWIVVLDIAIFAPSTTGRSLEEVNVV
jgi:putative MFS transporter